MVEIEAHEVVPGDILHIEEVSHAFYLEHTQYEC